MRAQWATLVYSLQGLVELGQADLEWGHFGQVGMLDSSLYGCTWKVVVGRCQIEIMRKYSLSADMAPILYSVVWDVLKESNTLLRQMHRHYTRPMPSRIYIQYYQDVLPILIENWPMANRNDHCASKNIVLDLCQWTVNLVHYNNANISKPSNYVSSFKLLSKRPML